MRQCVVAECQRLGLRLEERRTASGEWVGPLCKSHADAIDLTPERFVVLVGVLIELPPAVRTTLFCTRGHRLVMDEAARVWVHESPELADEEHS